MIAIINYDAGNTASVKNVLDELGVEYKLTKTESDICKSDKIIFPGVGEASYAIRKLHMYNLFNLLRIVKKPLLGICLGMQLLCNKTEEGNTACLGVFETDVLKFDSTKNKVPHMGWNEVEYNNDSKLFRNIKQNEHFYFAHSYYVPVSESTTSKTEYEVKFASSIEKNNFYGVQFHPEKSGDAGIQLIKNFIELC